MKAVLTSILFVITLTSFAQHEKKTETPIQKVSRYFKEYISTDDNSPSQEIREEMKAALLSLQQSCNDKDLPLLINVWMYYDPTDFRTRDLTEPIFIKHKAATLLAIDKRMKQKIKGENNETAPYSELTYLKEKLSK